MSALDDLVEGLKREVAVPGEFAASFPNTTDDDLVGTLADAFGSAQLDGFFGNMVLDLNLGTVTPDLSAAGAALIITYASERVLLSKLRNLASKTVYKAGGVEYSVEQSASVLTAELKLLQQRRNDIKAQAMRAARAGQAVYMVDAYVTRSMGHIFGYGSSAGFYGYELTGL
jgi:hypothetical protein